METLYIVRPDCQCFRLYGFQEFVQIFRQNVNRISQAYTDFIFSEFVLEIQAKILYIADFLITPFGFLKSEIGSTASRI